MHFSKIETDTGVIMHCCKKGKLFELSLASFKRALPHKARFLNDETCLDFEVCMSLEVAKKEVCKVNNNMSFV